MAQARPDYSKIHTAINDDKIEDVERLLDEKNGLVDRSLHFYDAKLNSAASVALKCGNDKIYEFLVSKGIRIGPHEQIDEIVKEEPPRKQLRLENIRSIHKKYFKDPNLNHLFKLNSISKLSHEAPRNDRREYLRLITEAFEDLNDSVLIKPVLKVASTVSNLKIVFDFNRHSVNFLDPNKKDDIMGTAYPEENCLFVGAKDLIAIDGQRSPNHNEVLAVLIHELSHIVMQEIYNNEAKPYLKDNIDKMLEFTNIVGEIELIKASEPYIDSVFSYPPT